MPGSIHAARMYNEEGFTLDAAMYLDELEEELNSPFFHCSYDGPSEEVIAEERAYEEQQEALAKQCYLESRIYVLQRKWDAFPLPHHAYSRKRDWLAHFPTDDDIPF